MFQHKESDFVIPVLKTISFAGGKCTTEYVKRNVHQHINLTEKDMMPYPSRNKNEPRYYQVVGNLISHKNAVLFTYINVLFENNENQLILNEHGKEYLKSLIDETNKTTFIEKEQTNAEPCQESNETKSEFTIVDPFDEKIMEFALKHGLNKRPPTDSKIVNTVFEISGYNCEYATSLGKKHNLFGGKSNRPYLEGHHLVPMKAALDFFPLNLDRPSNISPLCPGCHALLHHATKSEKEKVLRVLYDNHIEQLNSEGIYISFEKLLENYY